MCVWRIRERGCRMHNGCEKRDTEELENEEFQHATELENEEFMQKWTRERGVRGNRKNEGESVCLAWKGNQTNKRGPWCGFCFWCCLNFGLTRREKTMGMCGGQKTWWEKRTKVLSSKVWQVSEQVLSSKSAKQNKSLVIECGATVVWQVSNKRVVWQVASNFFKKKGGEKMAKRRKQGASEKPEIFATLKGRS